MTTNSRPTLNTSQNINHVFLCNNEKEKHVHSGFAILQTSKLICPTCGADVKDITGSRLAQEYYAFARPDKGIRQ